jgi:Mannosyltransferase (PIG-V)
VETVPERLDPDPLPIEIVAPNTAAIDEPTVRRARTRTRRRARTLAVSREEVLALMAIYFATRGLLLLCAYLLSSFGHHNFLHELANWDGLWYRKLANHGYPGHASYLQTTLGFFPLYPIAIWTLEPAISLLTGHDSIWSATVAGLLISAAGGAVATYYVYRLAADWWGRQTAFRAAVLFIVFPGSVVFSMVYSEGLLLPLAIACLFALGRKRWLVAGVLAGFATAVQPVAVVLIIACATAGLAEWRRSGWRTDVLRRVIVAPILSLTGVAAFAVFLWFWTGTPLANYEAQHHGWGEKTDAFALGHLTRTLIHEVFHTNPHEPPLNLNLVVGLAGAFVLLGMLVLVYHQRHRIPPAALVWTAGVAFLAVTSEYVPPNPRMLITAFPALMALAYYARGKGWAALLWTNVGLLILLSVLTFHATTLRP